MNDVVSRFTDLAYQRVNFMTQVDITKPTSPIFTPGTQELTLDALDQLLIDLFESITVSTPFFWASGMSLTTISYKFYGNTTWWWIILGYNGLQTPWQLQPGMRLNIPNSQQVRRFVNTYFMPNTAGTLVTLP